MKRFPEPCGPSAGHLAHGDVSAVNAVVGARMLALARPGMAGSRALSRNMTFALL